MTPIELIGLAAIGGGVGAWLRIVIRDECVDRGMSSWCAIMLINLLGSAVAGASLNCTINSPLWALFVLGFLAGFTTFSSMCIEVVSQWLIGCRRRACVIGIGTLVGGPLLVCGAAVAVTGLTTSASAATSTALVLRGRRIRHHSTSIVAIVAGGIVGTALRASLYFSAEKLSVPFWTATAVANIVGAGCAGFVFRWLCALDANGAARHTPIRRVRLERVLIFGFAGGLTTVSTLSVEIYLAAMTNPVDAVLIFAVNLGLGLLATSLGWWIASRCFPQREPLAPAHSAQRHAQMPR